MIILPYTVLKAYHEITINIKHNSEIMQNSLIFGLRTTLMKWVIPTCTEAKFDYELICKNQVVTCCMEWEWNKVYFPR
jgi:hypothetical protein